MDTTKRLFIGFRLNDDWGSAIQEFISGQELLSVRWIPEDNWHLTLLFLGECPNDKISELGNALAAHFKKQKPFAIPFDTFVYAPNARKARMIWCKGASNRNYTRLVDSTYSVVKDYFKQQNLPVAIEKHPEAIPHITLSRFPHGSLPPLRIPNAHSFPMPLSCREVVLFESELDPEGAQYKPVASFQLGQLIPDTLAVKR